MVSSISVLGSTGSIGRQTLAVADRLGIPVKALSANSNTQLLEQQARKFKPEFVCVYDESAAAKLKTALSDTDICVGGGINALIDCAAQYGDCVVTAVSGSVGLMPTLAAIKEKKRIALANKETLVCAGDIVMAEAKKAGAEIIPVDSEHSAIFQCLESEGAKKCLSRILLTGSGGPFRGKARYELENVTPAQAVAHPNWSMGAKISVDSATLMNKGLEFIEAMHLFSVSPEQIQVVIHPESIIHSMVEFTDGCVMAQMGVPSMTLPIQYALTYPSRKPEAAPAPDLFKIAQLNFDRPDFEKTPCLKLAMDCAARKGTFPAVMSAANELAVGLFLRGKLGFNAIFDEVTEAVAALGKQGTPTLEEITAADEAARRFVEERHRSI